MMKKYLPILCALLATACDDMRLQKPEELGTDAGEYIVEAAGGRADVEIYSNMPGRLYVEDSPSWLSLSAAEFASDAVISVNVEENPGARRMAAVVLCTQARTDTVFIKQKGAYQEHLDISTASIVAYNGEDAVAQISSNVDPAAVAFRKVYLDAGVPDWIRGVKIETERIVLSTDDNPDEGKVRRAVIELRYTDGWNDVLGGSLRITHADSRNKVGNEISFEELRSLVADDSRVVINDSYTLEGYVVSDRNCGNAGDNIQTSYTTIDSTVCHRTAYLESPDARYGVALEFTGAADNILDNNTKAVINLEGATLIKETDPLRYTLSGLSASRVVSAEAVEPSEIPVKQKRMSELTDDDIYTRVTLTDCEWPVRKGSLTPVNEGYAFLYKTQRLTKFPSLIRDIEGSSMYVYTNTTCTYRRDGSRMGYGSGSITGVIVHEKYRRFVDGDNAGEELCGNIGRYQIRHMSRSDFAFSDSFKDGFSEMICEWRYLVQGNDDNSWNATYGSGTMDHSYPGSVQNVFNTHAYPVTDFSYLGPCGTAHKTNENAFGIILEDGTDYGKSYGFDPQKGNLPANNTIALAWMSSNWWNDSLSAPECWLVHFSTAGISTDRLSMQLSMLNSSQEAKSPVQWKAQWAESASANAVWHDIAYFTVPDVVLYTVTQPWQSAGFKPMDIALPLEMLGKDNVYIRLIPSSRKANTASGYLDTNYVNGTAGSATRANSAMNYFAIRYNK